MNSSNSVLYNVQCSVQYIVQYNSQYSVQYSVSYNLQEAGKRLNFKEFASSASHVDVWLQCIVQDSVQCTVECTLYCSVQYRYVGCPGNQWDVTKTKGKRKKSFFIAFRHNNLFPLLR